MKEAKLLIEREDEGSTRRRRKAISVGGKNYLIADKIKLDKRDGAFEDFLKQQTGEYILYFESFTPFKEDIRKLEALSKSGFRFIFKDFKHLDQDSIDAIIEFLNLSRQEKSENIKKALRKVRAEGKELGNPEIGDAKGKAIRTRKLRALIDDSIIDARLAITQIRKEYGQHASLNQIADQLNERGLKPRRGKKFYAKTVQRILNSEEELKTYFEPVKNELQLRFTDNIVREKDLAGHLSSASATEASKELEVTGLEVEKNFDYKIDFRILSPLKGPFEVVICDNENARVFHQVYPADQKEVSIDLREHSLLPGRHYISIQTEEVVYNTFLSAILLRKCLLQLV